MDSLPVQEASDVTPQLKLSVADYKEKRASMVEIDEPMVLAREQRRVDERLQVRLCEARRVAAFPSAATSCTSAETCDQRG